MFPIRDNLPSRSTPVVNYLLIAACALVFYLQLNRLDQGEQLVEQYGLIPARVMHPGQPLEITRQEAIQTPQGVQIRETTHQVATAAVPPWATLLTCIFLHGGWMHIIGNMWFLYIFGDNIEDRFGHIGYLLFYLGCGVAASLTHLVSDTASTMPTIGASGAIAGVMGAYLLLYPRARILTLVPIFIFLQLFLIPAPVFLGIWFLIQFLQGTYSISSAATAGVAWWAHIGGFVTGAAVAYALQRTHHLYPPPPPAAEPDSYRLGGPRGPL